MGMRHVSAMFDAIFTKTTNLKRENVQSAVTGAGLQGSCTRHVGGEVNICKKSGSGRGESIAMKQHFESFHNSILM
jgi:hypothetical protein